MSEIGFNARAKGHSMTIGEIAEEQGVNCLYFSCHVCGVSEYFNEEKYPKYRLALAAAEAAGAKHAGVDKVAWALVL